MAEQVPSVGRIVHYVNLFRQHVPAVVVDIHNDGTLHLFVMDPSAQRPFEEHVVQTSDGSQPGSWHWPEYVPAKGV